MPTEVPRKRSDAPPGAVPAVRIFLIMMILALMQPLLMARAGEKAIARVYQLVFPEELPKGELIAVVRLYPEGLEVRPKIGQSLRPSDELRTGPHSFLGLRFYSNTLAWLNPASYARVRSLEPGSASLQLLEGKLRVVVSHLFGEVPLEVQARGVTAAAAGTDFLCQLLPNGEVEVQAYEGTVSVTLPGGGHVTLPAGQWLRVDANGNPKGPEALLEADSEKGSSEPPTLMWLHAESPPPSLGAEGLFGGDVGSPETIGTEAPVYWPVQNPGWTVQFP